MHRAREMHSKYKSERLKRGNFGVDRNTILNCSVGWIRLFKPRNRWRTFINLKFL
jgi:hypothetical protein